MSQPFFSFFLPWKSNCQQSFCPIGICFYFLVKEMNAFISCQSQQPEQLALSRTHAFRVHLDPWQSQLWRLSGPPLFDDLVNLPFELCAQHSGSNKASQSPERSGHIKENAGLPYFVGPSMKFNLIKSYQLDDPIKIAGSYAFLLFNTP